MSARSRAHATPFAVAIIKISAKWVRTLFPSVFEQRQRPENERQQQQHNVRSRITFSCSTNGYGIVAAVTIFRVRRRRNNNLSIYFLILLFLLFLPLDKSPAAVAAATAHTIGAFEYNESLCDRCATSNLIINLRKCEKSSTNCDNSAKITFRFLFSFRF